MSFTLFLVVFFGSVFSEIEIYTTIEDIVESYDDQSESLEKIFMFSLQSCECVQLLIDESPFSTALLLEIHRLTRIRPLMIGDSPKMSNECHGFIVIVDSLKKIKSSTAKIPLYSENRLVVFVKNNNTDTLNKFLKNNTMVFGSIDVLLISSNDFKIGYKMGQTRKIFREDKKMEGEWDMVQGKRALNFHGRTIKVLTYNCSIFSIISPPNNETEETSIVLYYVLAFKMNKCKILSKNLQFKVISVRVD